MDIRRIQITGGSSYMVTLPKSWADSMGIKKNDPVNVTVQPNGGLLLTVNPDQASESRPCTIEADELESPSALYRCLVGAYIAGHNQILVRSDGPLKGSFLEVVSEFTQTSMGMEIIEEDESHILIKDLIDHSEIVPQKNVRREYLLVKRMVSDALGPEQVKPDDMVSRDTEVDRIHWLVQRQASILQNDIGLGFKMGLDVKDVTSYMGVSKTLERMGDHAVLVSEHVGAMSERDRKEVLARLGALKDVIPGFITDAVESWFNADRRLAEKVICWKRSAMDRISETFDGISRSDLHSLLKGSCTRIVEYCTDIAESAINLSMESE